MELKGGSGCEDIAFSEYKKAERRVICTAAQARAALDAPALRWRLHATLTTALRF
jgi:hypothetical protein